MALGTFTPPASGTAGSFDPRTNHSKPLIVVCREFREGFTTRRFPTPKDVVICDVVDLLADTVHVAVIWGGGAMVDRLKGSVPTGAEVPERLPVTIVPVTAGNGGTYYVVEPLEGTALQVAVAWDEKYPTRIDDERATKLAADQANGQATAATGNASNGGGAPLTGLGKAQNAQPEEPQAAPEPAPKMSDADLEAALAALAG